MREAATYINTFPCIYSGSDLTNTEWVSFWLNIGPKKELHCRQITRKTSTIAIYLSLHWPYGRSPEGNYQVNDCAGLLQCTKQPTRWQKKRKQANKNLILHSHKIPFLNDIWVNYTFAWCLPNFCWGIYSDKLKLTHVWLK